MSARIAILCTILLVLAAGCVERRMTIRSEPPQAVVYLEGAETGLTPCTVEFVHYGTREISLQKQGYETKKVYQKITPPWYQIFPLDMFFEMLWPFKMTDQRAFTYKLEPVKPVDEKELLSRAEKMGREAMRIPTK